MAWLSALMITGESILSQEVMHKFNTPGPMLALTVNPLIAPTEQLIQMPTSDTTLPMNVEDLPTRSHCDSNIARNYYITWFLHLFGYRM